MVDYGFKDEDKNAIAIDINDHFEQHLIVEKWSAARGYFIDDTPDFVDYLRRFRGAITNYSELDFYYAWYRQ